MKHHDDSAFLHYLGLQLKTYQRIYSLSEQQKAEAGKKKISPLLPDIVQQRNLGIKEIKRVEILISQLHIEEKRGSREALAVQAEIKSVIEKIISNDNETGELIKRRKNTLSQELSVLNKGKGLKKKYGLDGDQPNLLSIRK
ncbi:MAG: hypothetical protein ACE5FU_05585 [Nitrospinota bacterium]